MLFKFFKLLLLFISKFFLLSYISAESSFNSKFLNKVQCQLTVTTEIKIKTVSCKVLFFDVLLLYNIDLYGFECFIEFVVFCIE